MLCYELYIRGQRTHSNKRHDMPRAELTQRLLSYICPGRSRLFLEASQLMEDLKPLQIALGVFFCGIFIHEDRIFRDFENLCPRNPAFNLGNKRNQLWLDKREEDQTIRIIIHIISPWAPLRCEMV